MILRMAEYSKTSQASKASINFYEKKSDIAIVELHFSYMEIITYLLLPLANLNIAISIIDCICSRHFLNCKKIYHGHIE